MPVCWAVHFTSTKVSHIKYILWNILTIFNFQRRREEWIKWVMKWGMNGVGKWEECSGERERGRENSYDTKFDAVRPRFGWCCHWDIYQEATFVLHGPEPCNPRFGLTTSRDASMYTSVAIHAHTPIHSYTHSTLVYTHIWTTHGRSP